MLGDLWNIPRLDLSSGKRVVPFLYGVELSDPSHFFGVDAGWIQPTRENFNFHGRPAILSNGMLELCLVIDPSRLQLRWKFRPPMLIYPVFQAPRLANVHFPVGKPENVDPPLWGDAIVAAHAGIRIHSCHTLRKTYTLTQVSTRACAALPEMNSQTELSLQEDDTALVTALKLNTTAHTHQWQTQTLTTPSLSVCKGVRVCAQVSVCDALAPTTPLPTLHTPTPPVLTVCTMSSQGLHGRQPFGCAF